MHVIVSGIGSAGDVNPFIEVSRELVNRGHSVDFIASAYFEEKVKLSNLTFLPLGTREQYLQTAANPDLWHPLRGFSATWSAIKPWLRQHLSLIAERFRPGQTVLLNSTVAIGGRLAQEKLKIPAATVHLAPSCIISADAPPHFPGFALPTWLPVQIRRLILNAVDKHSLDSVCAAELNEERKFLELPAVSSVMMRWIHSPDLVIGAFPDWFAKIQNDWPANSVLTGFPIHRTDGYEVLSPALEAFIESGPPPVVFTAGSAMGDAREHFKKAAKVVELSRVRAIFVNAFPDQVRDLLPANAIHAEYAPFDQLLPRTSLIVHHGGIGTSTQALAAGTKQFIIPRAHDQFDNADRFRDLKVAEVGSVKESAEVQARKLIRLLKDQNASAAIGKYKQIIESSSDPRIAICHLLEELHTRTNKGSKLHE